MSRLTAESGVDLLLHDKIRELRFFGGEPLLEFELLKTIIERVQQSGKAPERLLFRITTNATLLDDDKLAFIESNPGIQLVLSIDGSEESHIGQRRPHAGNRKSGFDRFEKYIARITALKRPVIVNMVVCPQNVISMVENFTFLIRRGLRRVNILPAFYVEWSEEQILELRSGFKKLAALVDKLWSDGFNLEIENLHVNVEKPLLSGGLLLDCDGSVYMGDIAMLFEPGESRRRFSLGNIERLRDLAALTESFSPVDEKALSRRFSDAALTSTKRVDAELSRFVAALKSIRKGG